MEGAAKGWQGMQGYTLRHNNEGIPHDKRGISGAVAQWVTRVSLSDWLALQARIRGSKDPRLLRDRPSDGAALQRNLCRILSTIENVLRLTDKRNQIAQRPAAPNQAADNQSDAITKKNTAH